MDGYFKEAQNRFFFLYGRLDDEFCQPDLTLVNFEKVLYQHLKNIGYQVVLFYNGRQGLRYADKQSRELSRPRNAANNPPQPRPSRIAKGALGHRCILDNSKPQENANQQELPDDQDLTFRGVNDLEIIGHVEAFMKKTDHKTVIIFNGTDFISHFSQVGRRAMDQVLQDCSHLPALNENIIIFQFTGITPGDMLRAIDRHEWLFLRGKMFEEGGIPTKQLIAISSPREDEVKNLLNHWRIVKQMPVDWLSFQQAVTQITRSLCGEGRTLKDLIAQIKTETALNKQSFAKMAGQLENLPALERLKQLRGLELVTERLERLIKLQKEQLQPNPERTDLATAKKNKNEVNRLLPPPKSPAKGVNLHIALKGSPGTGKTESAKLIGEIYRDEGLLPLGHTVKVVRADLVAGYVGQTALKTAQKIADAMGGVLFIDEAYSLVQGVDDRFGQEAIDTLVEAMTNYMGEFSVIIAGYPDKIEGFIAANPGLKSRFSLENTLTIPDYNSSTLQYIFEQKVKKEGRQIQPELQKALPFLFENIYAERTKDFGNARYIMNLYQEMNGSRSERVARHAENSDRMQLTTTDVPIRYQAFLRPRKPEDLDSILNQLDHLVGLAEVKEAIRSIIEDISAQRRRARMIGNNEGNTQIIPGHYLFLGNPGTGKTTVARLMGQIFRNLGLLERGEVIEVGRADLVGGYLGQSALKTKAVLERSFDNILFIDEAYQMINGPQDDFGKEAFDTLVADMETHRDRLCIIAAGYPAPMDALIKSNVGFKSRFGNPIIFANYNASEMLTIFQGMANAKNLTLAEGVEEKLLAIFKVWETNQSPDFGNGRDVRNLFDKVCRKKSSRINTLSDEELSKNPHLFDLIEQTDVPLP